MNPDPPVRSDGRCARPGCGKPRKMPASNAAKAYIDRRHYEADPWCSTDCCRTYHGVEMTVTRTGLGRGGGRQKVYA